MTMEDSFSLKPPAGWCLIRTIDVHVAGEPLRVITSGLPPIPGKTMLEKRSFAVDKLDELRRTLIWEPRGHADMYGCILTEPVSPDSHFGVLFLHNEGFSTMCGHGIIGLVTVVVESGWVDRLFGDMREKRARGAMEGQRVEKELGKKAEANGGRREVEAQRMVVLKIDTPAGQVRARAEVAGGRVKCVSFLNVPSFVYAQDQEIDAGCLGRLHYDVAFGGAFYAFVRAEKLGVRLVPEEFRRLIELGSSIKKAVAASLPIRHPFEPDLGFLYGTIIVGPPANPGHHSRNVCIFADGEVDRSPTGTGVSARAALHFIKGELEIGDSFTVESILGTCFEGRLVEKTQFGPYEAVIPEVTGSAYITGKHEFWINPDDPLRGGFLLR